MLDVLSRSVAAFLFCALFVAAAPAPVVFDGSVGSAGSLKGGVVSSKRGKQVGPNLFHSFSRFSVPSGQVVTFDGPSSVQRILARVTGGQPSHIDGTLKSAIRNADFYLINPSGILFGPGARIDLSGSFICTTADYLGFEDDGVVHVDDPKRSVLSSAPPSAFGFSSHQPAEIRVVGDGTTRITSRNEVSFIGGSIQISNARLAAPGGKINLISVGSPGEVQPIQEIASVSAELKDFSKLGAITISNRARVTVRDDSGGTIVVRANSLRLQNASIIDATTINGQGGGAIVRLNQDLIVDRSRIDSTTNGNGAAGNLTIEAGGAIRLTGNPESDFLPGLYSNSGMNAVLAPTAAELTKSGDGGRISVKADTLEIRETAEIAAITGSMGNGGDISLEARSISLEMTGDPFEYDPSHRRGTDIVARSSERAVGNGGQIKIDADVLTINRGLISVTTRGLGAGGDLIINAGTISIGGVKARSNDNSLFALSAKSEGESILDGTRRIATGGAGGNIVIHGDALQIDGDGAITAATEGDGAGGSVMIDVKSLILNAAAGDGAIRVTSTGKKFKSKSDAQGRAGSVSIRAEEFTIGPGSGIAVKSETQGEAGNIDIVTVGDALLDGGIISAEAKTNGGNIQLIVSGRLTLSDSSIAASARGDGGNITLLRLATRNEPAQLSGGSLKASAEKGVGGRIAIDRRFGGDFLEFKSLAGGEKPLTTTGGTTFDVTSQSGLSGSLDLALATPNFAEQLTPLNTNLDSFEATLHDCCELKLTRNLSSFVLTGRGGLPPQPDGWISIFPSFDSAGHDPRAVRK